MKARIHQLEPTRLIVDWFISGEQLHHDLHVLVQERAHFGRFKAEHCRVGRKCARTNTEHDAASDQMVEQHDALSGPKWVVVGQKDNTGAKLDVGGAGSGRCNRDLGAGDNLAAGRVVFADPRLVESECVHVLDQL
jgi:hypothetical protein